MLRLYKRIANAIGKVGKVVPAYHANQREEGIRQFAGVDLDDAAEKEGENDDGGKGLQQYPENAEKCLGVFNFKIAFGKGDNEAAVLPYLTQVRKQGLPISGYNFYLFHYCPNIEKVGGLKLLCANTDGTLICYDHYDEIMINAVFINAIEGRSVMINDDNAKK
ncbi:MAG: hypothetical protein JWO06_1687 [Bacteroidota bacterium]|nr:hypothetical protein [Bacteroidota bacterium]